MSSPITRFFSLADAVASLFDNLEDLRTLYALVRISPLTYEVFQTWPKRFMERALAQMPSEIRQIAIMLVAHDQYASDESRNAVREQFLSFQNSPFPEVMTNPVRSLKNLAAISRAVRHFTSALVMHCAGNIPAYKAEMARQRKARISWTASDDPPAIIDMEFVDIPTTTPQGLKFPMRDSESHRIQRAFWNYAIYSSVFSKSSKLDEYPTNEYLATLQPWEMEEFMTSFDFLRQIVDDTYTCVYEKYYQDSDHLVGPLSEIVSRGDIQEAATNEYYSSVDHFMATAGLPQLHHIYQQKLRDNDIIYPDRYSKLDSMQDSSIPSELTRFDRRNTIRLVGGHSHFRIGHFATKALRERADSPGCHLPSRALQALGWHPGWALQVPGRMATNGQTPWIVGREVRGMRGIGVAFWDR